MNKKSLMMLLFAATLGMTSCNDIQDLNLNFGDRTYVNEYEGLIAAVNNLSATLKERFDALSELLKKGMADIKVSIDENTGAIKIVGQNIATLDGDMKDGLGTINTTLFNGFKAVTTQIDETGKTIVAAMDENGNLLRLQIDETGKLISAQLITSTADLVKAMGDNTASLAEKLGLIQTAVEAGFADAVDAQKATNEAIKALQEEVEKGLKSTEQALKELTDALNTQTATLAEKVSALQAAVTTGLADVKTGEDLIKQAIEEAGNSNAERLQALTEAVNAQTTSLETKLTLVETAISTGLTTVKNGQDLIKHAIESLENQVKAGFISNEKAIEALTQAVSDMTISFETKFEVIKEAIANGFATVKNGEDLIKHAIESLENQVKAGYLTEKEAIDAVVAVIKDLKDEVKAGHISEKAAIEMVEAAIKAQTTSFEGKLALLDTAIKSGFADINLTIKATNEALKSLTDEVAAGNLSEKEALGKIEAAVKAQTTSLVEKVELLKGAITTGFANDQTAINNMATAIKTAINTLEAEVKSGNTSTANYLSQLVSAFTTLNTYTATTNTKLGEIKDELVKSLADNGVNINNDGKSIYVTPEIWGDIESAGKTSQLYNTFMDAIHDVTVPKVNNPIQVTPSADPSAWHKCAKFKNLGYDESTVQLVAGTLQPQTAANGKTVVKMIKAPSEVKFEVYDLVSCSYPYIYNIRVHDARGDYQIYGGAYGTTIGSRAAIGEATSMAIPSPRVSTTVVTLKSYYNGRICEEVKAYVFTYYGTTNLPTLFWPADAPK